MTTNEFYYLLLVIGGFGSFATALVLAVLKYKAWLRPGARHGHPAELNALERSPDARLDLPRRPIPILPI